MGKKGKKRMRRLFSKIATLSVGLAMAIGVGVALGGTKSSASPVQVQASVGDTHDFSQSIAQLLNNNATIDGIEIAEQEYYLSKVTVVGSYNKSYNPAVTITVSVGGDEVGVQNVGGSGNFSKEFELDPCIKGAVSISFENQTGSGTGHGTFNVTKVTLTEGDNTPAVFNGLDHIKITTNPVKTTFMVGETFSSSGLTVTAYDAENEAEANSKLVKTFTCGNGVVADYYDGRTLTSNDVGEKTVTISYTEEEVTKTTSYGITVNEVPRYYQITSTDDLTVGKNYLFGADEYVISTNQRNNNRGSTTIGDPDAEGMYVFTSSMQVLTLGGESGAYTLYASNGSNTGYLYAAGTSDNYLKTRESNNDNKSKWNITHDGKGFIVNCIDNSVRGELDYNSANDFFSCYAEGTGKYYIQIYREFIESEVVELTGLAFSQGTSGEVYVGGEYELAPVYTPGNATYKGLTWSSSNEGIATVEDGTITGVSAGTTTITATSEKYNTIFATFSITVKEVPVFELVSGQSALYEGLKVVLSTGTKIATSHNSGNNYLEVGDATSKAGGITNLNSMIFTVKMYGTKFALEYNGKYLYYQGASNTVYLAEKTLSSATAECGWTLDETGLKSNTSRYLRYNSAAPRFACYDNNSYAAVKLYKAADSVLTAEAKANTFLYRELHLRDVDVTNVSDGTACKGNSGYFELAKAAWNNAEFDEAKPYVLANKNAVDRLVAWAAANGETFDPVKGTFTKLAVEKYISTSSANYAIIIIVATVSITALGLTLMIVKKKKQD